MRFNALAIGFVLSLAACPQNGEQGRPCDNGACLPGYVCNASNICVTAPDGGVQPQPDAAAQPGDAATVGADAATAGADASASALDSGNRECRFDQNKYDDGCVYAQ